MVDFNERSPTTSVSALAGTGGTTRLVLMLTLGNALCGSLALAWAMAMWLVDSEIAAAHSLWRLVLPAGLLVVMGVILDGLDGWAARRWQVASDFGALADVVADAISFVLAPAMLVVAWTAWLGARCEGVCSTTGIQAIGLLAAIYYSYCGISRLRDHVREERRRSDEDDQAHETSEPQREGKVFSGLPTTASGLILTWSAIAMSAFLANAVEVTWAIWVLPMLAMLLGWLMVSSVPVPHPLRR